MNNRRKHAGIFPRGLIPSVAIISEQINKDNNKDFIQEIADALNELENLFKVFEIVRDGKKIWQVMLEYAPDIVIISNVIQGIDCRDLISKVKSSKGCADVLFFVITKDQEYEYADMNENFISGFISVKDPVDRIIALLIDKYLKYCKHITEHGMDSMAKWMKDIDFFSEMEVSGLLNWSMLENNLIPLGIEPKLSGKLYLEQIIAMKLIGIEGNLGDLYNYSAYYSNTTSAAVEKAIRYAIEKAWMKGDIYMQHQLFGNTTDESKGKPTNAEFINTIVEHMKNGGQSSIIIMY